MGGKVYIQKATMEDVVRIGEIFSKYEKALNIRVIDKNGRITIGKQFSGKYLNFIVLEYQGKVFVIGIIDKPYIIL